MPDPTMEELFREIETTSEEYGEKASQLSDVIAAFEARLQKLGGKAQVSVKNETASLTFQRVKPDLWRLIVTNHLKKGTGGAPLTNSPLESKILAIHLFKDLLVKILEIQAIRTVEIENALQYALSIVESTECNVREGKQ